MPHIKVRTEHLLFAFKALAITGAGFIGVWLSLIRVGVTSPINADVPDLSVPGLLAIVLWHAIFGTVLFGGVVMSGLAALTFVRPHWGMTTTDRLLLSLPIGLVIWLATCILVRIYGGGSATILCLIFGFSIFRLAYVLRRIGTKYIAQAIEFMRDNCLTITIVYILGISLAVHFGLLWRTPSEIPNGTIDIGDLVFYVASYHSLKISIYPYFLHAVEGEHFTYFNMLGPFLAFAFDDLPGFEISLFLTTSVTIFFFIGISYAVSCMYRYRINLSCAPLSLGTTCLIILMLCAATLYPSWIVETTPYAFAIPLALIALYLVERGNQRIEFYYVLIPLIVVSFAISKVMPVTVFGGYALLCFWIKARQERSRTALWILISSAVLIAIFCLLLLGIYGKKFLSFASATDFGPTSFHTFHHMWFGKGTRLLKAIYKTLPAFTMEFGLFLLPFGAARLRHIGLFLAVLGGVSLYFLYSYIFIPTATSAFILIAGWLIINPVTENWHRSATFWLFCVAALLVSCSHFMRDPGGWEFTLIWELTLGGAMIQLLLPAASSSAEIRSLRTWISSSNSWRYALAAVAMLSVIAQANGDLRLGRHDRKVVSTKLYDLWKNVRERTPEDALIFTDQVGDTEARLEGWNDLSLISERQFYFSSWQTSVLRGDVTKRRQRLQFNSEVLDGKLRPEELPLHRSYSSYFAAVRTLYPVPKTFERIYANADYVLYRIKQ